ncbi:MAG: MFS transporter, partial [Rubricella sp.]
MTISPAPSPAFASGRAAAHLWFFVNGAVFGTWAVRIPAFKAEFGLSEGTLGLVLLAMAFGAVTAFFWGGRWSDRIGASRAAALAAPVFILLLPCLALAPSPVTLALVLFAFGAAGGGLDLSMNAYGAEVEARRGRSSMSVMHALWSIGFGAASLAGWVAIRAGLDPMPHFLIVGAMMAALAIAAYRLAVPSNGSQAEGGAPFHMPTGPVLAAAIFAGIAFLGEGALLDWTAIHAVLTLGETADTGALLLALFSIVMVALRLSGDRLILRMGARRALAGATLLAITGPLVLGFAPGIAVASLGLVITACGYALMAPLAFSIAGRAPEPG